MVTPLSSDEQHAYLTLLQVHNTNRIDYNTRKWETVKFFQSIYGALMVATIAAIVAAHGTGHATANQLLQSAPFLTLLASLPLIASVSLVTAILNLRRESRWLFREEGTIFKLARFLKLDRVLADPEQWLPGDTHLLIEPWWNAWLGDTKHVKQFEQWVDERVRRHEFLRIFQWFFMFEIVIGVGITLAMLVFAWAR